MPPKSQLSYIALLCRLRNSAIHSVYDEAEFGLSFSEFLLRDLRFALAKRFLAVANSVSLCDRLSGADAVAAVSTGIGRRDFEAAGGHTAAGFSPPPFSGFSPLLMFVRDGTSVLTAAGAVSMSTDVDVVWLSAAPSTSSSDDIELLAPPLSAA